LFIFFELFAANKLLFRGRFDFLRSSEQSSTPFPAFFYGKAGLFYEMNYSPAILASN